MNDNQFCMDDLVVSQSEQSQSEENIFDNAQVNAMSDNDDFLSAEIDRDNKSAKPSASDAKIAAISQIYRGSGILYDEPDGSQTVCASLGKSMPSYVMAKEMVYSFCCWTITEWKLFCMSVAYLSKMEDEILLQRNTNCPKILIPLSDLAKVFGTSISNTRTLALSAVKGLQKKGVWKIKRSKSERRVYIETGTKFNVFATTDDNFAQVVVDGRKRNCLVLQLSAFMKQFVLNLKKDFLRERLSEILKFDNPHALRLYMFLSMFLKENNVDADDRHWRLKTAKIFLGVEPNSYKRFSDFNNRILQPAVEGINKSGLLRVTHRIEIGESKERNKNEDPRLIKFHFEKPRELPATQPPPIIDANPQKTRENQVVDMKKMAHDEELQKMLHKRGLTNENIGYLLKKFGYDIIKKCTYELAEWMMTDNFYQTLETSCEMEVSGRWKEI